ncbi:NAD-dependent aldehyde dehydrogenase [Mycena galopus ATCC 62051]|nr:NAD-dependent aldehyde dehydrogenase [Mycena galopus ATCC 62051]
MPATFTHHFDTPFYKGASTFPTGLFIGGAFVDATGKLLTKISEATPQDVETAVKAAQDAFATTWATLMEAAKDELSALEALDNGKIIRIQSGKTFSWANYDLNFSIGVVKYYAGWADKITGQTLETDEKKLVYTRHEPIGVVGQIIPSLATGNTIVLKPSEFTPLTALRMCTIIQEAGFPPGVVNVITGYGNTVGAAVSSHMDISKIAFTGSTLVGRKIMEAAAKSNLKPVTLELGGKSPNIIFNDADLENAVEWTAHGIYWNHGAACCAGSRIFVQSGIYDKFLEKFTEKSKSIRIGIHWRRIHRIRESRRCHGTLGRGSVRNGGYYINPTIFTNTTPEMKIVKEEFSARSASLSSSRTRMDPDVVRQANSTLYGLAAGVFSQDIDRAIRTAHRVQAGTIWVNCFHQFSPSVPFGGYGQSGIGRELGEYALHHYTNVKAVHINLGHRIKST